MRLFKLALAATVVGMAAGSAAAQQIRQPGSVQPTGFTWDYYAKEAPKSAEVQPSPSDIVIPPSIAGSGCAMPGGCAAPGACGSACCDPCGGCRPLFTFDGWLNGGFTYNAWDPVSNYNGVLSFNDRDDEAQMNQMYMILQRQTDTSDRVFDVGGRFDFLYGTDARFTQAAGLELNQDGTQGLNAGQRFYHMAFPQFYGDVAINDLTIRMGHWYTIIGYETVTAPDNFFYSHAYTMQYGEPFTHTGVLTMYQLTDNLLLYNGMHQGWDVFNVSNLAPAFTNRWSYIGGGTWTGFDELVRLTSTMSLGNENDGTGVFRQRSIFSGVASLQLTDYLQWVGQSDIGRQVNGSGVTPGTDAEWYGVNQYFFYSLTDTLRLGARGEWFRDDDGARVSAVGDANPAGGPFPGDFYQISLGANWLPIENFVMRPEVRWDWYDPAPGFAARPWNDDGAVGRNGSQFTAGIDGIISW
jgi:hypothetical protein